MFTAYDGMGAYDSQWQQSTKLISICNNDGAQK